MGRGGAQKLHKNLTEIIKISRALAGAQKTCGSRHGCLQDEETRTCGRRKSERVSGQGRMRSKGSE